MAPKQAMFLIPNDMILCTLVQTDAANGVINREFMFNGLGQQLTNGEVNPALKALDLPASALTENAAVAAGVPVFPAEAYIALIRDKKYEEAGALQGQFHEKLLGAKTATGQQGLADAVIDAIFAMLAQEDLKGWIVNRDSVICRVPARATDTTPVIIVVQPQPIWG